MHFKVVVKNFTCSWKHSLADVSGYYQQEHSYGCKEGRKKVEGGVVGKEWRKDREGWRENDLREICCSQV